MCWMKLLIYYQIQGFCRWSSGMDKYFRITFIFDVINYPYKDLSSSMLVKGALKRQKVQWGSIFGADDNSF